MKVELHKILDEIQKKCAEVELDADVLCGQLQNWQCLNKDDFDLIVAGKINSIKITILFRSLKCKNENVLKVLQQIWHQQKNDFMFRAIQEELKKIGEENLIWHPTVDSKLLDILSNLLAQEMLAQIIKDNLNRHEEDEEEDEDEEEEEQVEIEVESKFITITRLDVQDLIIKILSGTLNKNGQGLQQAILKLNLIAETEQGWLLIVQAMIDILPVEYPSGPDVIILFLENNCMLTKETVAKLFFNLNLSPALANSNDKTPAWHRNVCVVLGWIAEKLAGPNSVATFKPEILEYLIMNLNPNRSKNVILFSLIALEKFAQTSQNKVAIIKRLSNCVEHPLELLETCLCNPDYIIHQIGFCSRWALNNLFLKNGRRLSNEMVDMNGINVNLNRNNVSEYMKISPKGLEARCDILSFESVHCTFQALEGVWYYEATVMTSGIMQIGWATKDSKFLNPERNLKHNDDGIGDDEFSIAYDGCRQLIWHNASCHPHNHLQWKAGDVLGCLLDLDRLEVMFYLNGSPLSSPIYINIRTGFFAAASLSTFQQCRFNFGNASFRHPPMIRFQTFNDQATLSGDQKSFYQGLADADFFDNTAFQKVTDTMEECAKELQEMFPNIDMEVIKSVIEEKRSDKEATVNALLLLSEDMQLEKLLRLTI